MTSSTKSSTRGSSRRPQRGSLWVSDRAIGNRLRIAGPSEKSMSAAAARLNQLVSKSRIEDGA